MAGERLLIVEDDLAVRYYLVRFCGYLGYAVRNVHAAAAALEALDQEPVDLVVSDIQLPGMNGCALARAIVQRWPGTRLLLISGYVPTDLVAQADCEPMMPLLSKPFALYEFKQAVRDALAAPPWRPKEG